MYSIFHPLDPNEQLPRELVLEGRRHRHLEKATALSAASVLYLPALLLSIIVIGSFQVSMVMALVIGGVALLGATLLGVCLYPFLAGRD